MSDLLATRAYERACKLRVAEATPSTYAATWIEYTAGEMHDELLALVANLETENERLKVCGNCGNHDDAVYSRCAVDGHAVPYSVVCKFTPSRWTARAEKAEAEHG